jgi:FtsH-binding integral membrane protein
MAGLEAFIQYLQAAGFPLVLLWLLTLAVVYGVLSHIGIPKAKSVQGVIAICAAFLILLAAAAGPAAVFISNLTIAGILIAFGLIITVIFMELVGLRAGEVFPKHPRFFAAALIILVILIFVGAGGLGIIKLPAITITEPILAVLFFVAVMAAAIWVLMRETK